VSVYVDADQEGQKKEREGAKASQDPELQWRGPESKGNEREGDTRELAPEYRDRLPRPEFQKVGASE